MCVFGRVALCLAVWAGWRKVKKGEEEKWASDSSDSNKIASNVGFPFLYLRPLIFSSSSFYRDRLFSISQAFLSSCIPIWIFTSSKSDEKRLRGGGRKNKKEKSKLRNEVSISGAVYCTVHSSSLFLISLSCPTTIPPPVSILTSSLPIPSNCRRSVHHTNYHQPSGWQSNANRNFHVNFGVERETTQSPHLF